jgi:hypothetical protein
MRTTVPALALGLRLVSAIVLSGPGIGVAQAAEELPAEIIAVQIRDQGYPCDKPLNAERDRTISDDAVWILNCKNDKCRVRLVPDMAADVTRFN